MRTKLKITAIIMLFTAFAFTACKSDGGGDSAGGGSAPFETGFDTATNPGNIATVTAGSETADMIYANNQASIIFPFSPTAFTPVNDSTATLTRKFFMSETQVTNALFAEVLNWALDNGKIVESVPVIHNQVTAATVMYGSRELIDLDYDSYAGTYMKINYSSGSFIVDSGYEDHPVVCVSWYGAIMFCNWLTEMRDGNTTNLVYTSIATDGTWNNSNAYSSNDDSKTGYRLPSSQEWEYAARYIGTTAPTGNQLATDYVSYNHGGGNASLTAGYYWTPAAYPSGGTLGGYTGTAATDYSRFNPYCWYGNNTSPNGNTTTLQPVAQKTANQLGLRDMSGNVWEWCYTASGSRRVIRGGSRGDSADFMLVGFWHNYFPSFEDGCFGFRFARTQ